MYIAIVTKGNETNHLITSLTRSMNDVNYSIVYNVNVNDTHLSLHEHLNLVAIELQKILLSDLKCLSNVATPVLVILDNNVDLSAIVKKHVDTDTIFFNSLHNMIRPTAIYGSIVSITKVLRSAVQLRHFFKDDNQEIIKPPFRGSCHELFQLIWYSQKIGLKVYESE